MSTWLLTIAIYFWQYSQELEYPNIAFCDLTLAGRTKRSWARLTDVSVCDSHSVEKLVLLYRYHSDKIFSTNAAHFTCYGGMWFTFPEETYIVGSSATL